MSSSCSASERDDGAGPDSRSRPLLILLHGWAFDRTIWERMTALMPELDHRALDLGYLCAPAALGPVPEGCRVVAVGHSLGALLLLRHRPFRWDALVCINGFARFTEAPDLAGGHPRRVLDRMIARLEADPATVVADFRKRCGAEPPPAGIIDTERLQEGLLTLRDADARAALAAVDEPVLLLEGAADPIVSPALSAQSLAGLTGAQRLSHPNAGHLLPATEPEWCAAAIRGFLAGLPPR